MKTIALLAVIAATTALACTEGVHGREPATTSIRQAPGPSTCPLGVPGAHVSYEETPVGGALVFTAPADRVEDLRERARYASAVHGPERLGKGHDGKHGSGHHHGIKAMQLPPAWGSAQDVEHGARVSFTPADPADADLLRAKLKARAQEMMAGCE
jgi:hypothetical protein